MNGKPIMTGRRTRTGRPIRTRKRGAVLVAVSGPDDAGKSTLVRRLAPLLRRRGYTVISAYCYGCVLCRRFHGPPRWRNGTGGGGRRRRVSVLGRWIDRVHATADAAELAVRLTAARTRALTARARGRPAVVVTDRGPLDGLAKFGPPPGSLPARLSTRLARCYDVTLLLDRGPSGPEGSSGPVRVRAAAPVADDPWAAHREWAGRLPAVARLDAALPPAALAGAALPHIPRARREHVVLSTFDGSGNPFYGGGGAVVIEKVAQRLADEFRVTVVTAARRGGIRRDGAVRYRRVPVCWAGPRGGQLLYQALLPFIAVTLRHDLWLESFTPPFSTGFLPLLTRHPVVGIDQLRSGDAMSERYHLPFFLVEHLGLRLYRDVVVLNEADADAVRRLTARTSVTVIGNGVEHRPVDGERLGFGDHILYLGRIETREKGLDLLLAAAAKGRLSLPLVIAGGGTRAEQRRLADLLAAQDGDVRWLGPVSGRRKQDLLRDSAFVVLPSRHETFGLAALEAMACGKPVLHFDLPALRWMRGGGGVEVPPFDVDLLAERMRRLAADRRWRQRLGREAYERAQRYTWEETTGRYLALARRVLDAPAPRTHPDGQEGTS